MDDDMLITDLAACTTIDPEPVVAPGELHARTIIHIDIDCFYAQVEELADPSLRSRPLGIQQKNCLVTCNYVARARGVGKLQSVAEALRACPELVLVRGEDLTKYRKMSAAVFELLHGFTASVEKLGLDENYLDVTALVADRLASAPAAIEGHVHPPGESLRVDADAAEYADDDGSPVCRCGCARRLAIGTQLAREIRERLRTELGLTTCAGIAHNKQLAKWVGTRNKPNQQTVFVPWLAAQTMRQLTSLREFCGIGERTEVLLRELHIETAAQLQDAPIDRLRRQFGAEMAGRLKAWSFGRDTSAVKPSGAPKTIGLEDSCRSISVRIDVEEKFRLLLIRLIEHVIEDGRIPIVIKITVRKFDATRRSSHRETKQANIMPTLFRMQGDGKIITVPGAHDKLLKIVMRLFERSVDLGKPFNITLLGLAFSKFQDKRREPTCANIANFLIKKSDVEVQSITSLSSDGYSSSSLNTTAASALSSSSDSQTPRYVTSSPVHMDFESISDTSHASCSSDVSESEIEPSPKKSRVGGSLVAKRRCFRSGVAFDASSPSKLRVGELRLNSRDHSDSSAPVTPAASPGSAAGSLATPSTAAPSPLSSPASMSLYSLFYPSPPQMPRPVKPGADNAACGAAASPAAECGARLPDVCPPSVDPDVFRALPVDVQDELLAQWRGHPADGGISAGASASASLSVVATNATGAKPKSSKANTLHRYFIANSQ